MLVRLGDDNVGVRNVASKLFCYVDPLTTVPVLADRVCPRVLLPLRLPLFHSVLLLLVLGWPSRKPTVSQLHSQHYSLIFYDADS